MKTSLSGYASELMPHSRLIFSTVAISCDHRYINFNIWAIASLDREKNAPSAQCSQRPAFWYFDISWHTFFFFFFQMARMLACPATFNFANKVFFLGRIVSSFAQIVVCRLAAMNSCCLKLLKNTVLVTLSTNWLNYFIICLLKFDWLGVLSAYFDSFRYRPGNARESSALSR